MENELHGHELVSWHAGIAAGLLPEVMHGLITSGDGLSVDDATRSVSKEWLRARGYVITDADVSELTDVDTLSGRIVEIRQKAEEDNRQWVICMLFVGEFTLLQKYSLTNPNCGYIYDQHAAAKRTREQLMKNIRQVIGKSPPAFVAPTIVPDASFDAEKT